MLFLCLIYFPFLFLDDRGANVCAEYAQVCTDYAKVWLSLVLFMSRNYDGSLEKNLNRSICYGGCQNIQFCFPSTFCCQTPELLFWVMQGEKLVIVHWEGLNPQKIT